jgi:hypothetical protein
LPNAHSRVLVITDSDSYVKWGAHVAGQLPEHWTVRFTVACGNIEPTARQVREALDGSRFTPQDVERVTLPDVRAIMQDWTPDVVLLAMRGLGVRAALDAFVADRPDRPVVVSGLPGLSYPVFGLGLRLRRGVDLYVLHSRREVRAFTEIARQMEVPHRFELATLPFAGPSGSDQPRDRVVFAAQAKVPARKRQRIWLLEQLAETARRHPQWTVVVKVRGVGDEPQTHDELYPYDVLIGEVADRPANLVLESGSMREHLGRAAALVSVSSTALLEAIAAGVPCLALTDFGVDAQQINTVFLDSAVLGASDELVTGQFHSPKAEWLDDNYFHGREHDTWVAAVEELLEQRAAEGLAPIVRPEPHLLSAVTLRYFRKLAFVASRGTRRDRLERATWAAVLQCHQSILRLRGSVRDGVSAGSGVSRAEVDR